MWKKFKEFIEDERGSMTVEIILLLVIIIALVLVFKKEMTDIVTDIFNKIVSQTNKVLT